LGDDILVTPEMLYQARIAVHNLSYTHWITEELLTVRWWGLLMFVIFTYTLCFYLIDKKRFAEILLFGALLAVMVHVVDTFATSFVLWSFAVRFFPIAPSVFLNDLTLVPLYYMLVYQYTSSLKQYFIWDAIAAGLMSFFFLPMLAFFKIYQLHNWSYFYNFLVLLAVGVVARLVIAIVMSIEHRRREGHVTTPLMTPLPAMKPLSNENDSEDKK
jgi:hypothetical protein